MLLALTDCAAHVRDVLMFPPSSTVVRSWRQVVQETNPDMFFSSNALQLFLGNPKVFPDQRRHTTPPTSSWSSPGPHGKCLENLQSQEFRKPHSERPESLQQTFFDTKEQWKSFEDLITEK